jgi:molybdopterin biosynthesis enzyme MoaB
MWNGTGDLMDSRTEANDQRFIARLVGGNEVLAIGAHVLGIADTSVCRTVAGVRAQLAVVDTPGETAHAQTVAGEVLKQGEELALDGLCRC